MTVVTDTPLVSHTTDAEFRSWGSAFKALLTAAGLTNTSDTGQVNWSTVTRAGSNADAGYEIWRWNDSAHSTTPMFLKVRYGTGGTTSRPRIRIDIGEGSNGSGSLTGAIKTDFGQWHHRNDTAGYDTWSICYNTTVGFLGFRFGPTASSSSVNQSMVCIDRLKNTDGTPSTRGFAVWKSQDTDSTASQYWTLTPGSWSSDPSNAAPVLWPWRADGAGSGAGVVIAPFMPFSGQTTHGPLEKTIGIMAVGVSDFSGGNTFTATRWDGDSYTYIVGDERNANNTNERSYYTRTAMLWQ